MLVCKWPIFLCEVNFKKKLVFNSNIYFVALLKNLANFLLKKVLNSLSKNIQWKSKWPILWIENLAFQIQYFFQQNFLKVIL